MAWLRSRPPPGRLFLTRADGRSLRRELPAELLERFAARILETGGEESLATWKRAGQLGSEALRAGWPEMIPHPERAMLGAGDRKSGPWLEACYPRGAALPEIAEDLARWLAGALVPERVVPEPEEPPQLAPTAPLRQAPPRRATAPPVQAPEASSAGIVIPAPRAETPRSAPAPPPAAPVESLPEVLAPGARISPARAPTLRPHEDDVFSVWGEAHPDDLAGDSPELRGEDLPWLCPGDPLYSPRRGACRLLALDDGQGRWRLRDERGREIEISSSELTAEFSFDEPEAPRARA